MHLTFPPLRRTAICAAALAQAALHGQAQAALCTWTGTGGTSAMSNTANWDCGGGPTTGDSLVFPASAPSKSVNADLFEAFVDATFAAGYDLSGTLWVRNLTDMTAPFSASGAVISGEGTGSVTIHGSGLAEIGSLDSIEAPGNIQVTGDAHARINATVVVGEGPIIVGAGSRLSAGQAVKASTLTVAAGGTLAVSEPPTGAVAGSTVGSLTVTTGAATFAAGSTLEYLASTTYDSGHLVAQNGLALNGATLRIVVEDPANPDAIGFMRTLAAYTDFALLSGRFAGLPATGSLIEASNAPGVWYSISYGVGSNPFMQITRVATPAMPPPGPGGPASIPVLGPAGLVGLSALLAGAGARLRRRRGR